MIKGTNITIEVALELNQHLTDVWCERHGAYGGFLHINFEKGPFMVVAYRLYEECKEDYNKFPSKVRISCKKGKEKYAK